MNENQFKKAIKLALGALSLIGNSFLAGMFAYTVIVNGNDEPLHAAFCIGTIVMMFNVFIVCCTAMCNENEDENEKR